MCPDMHHEIRMGTPQRVPSLRYRPPCDRSTPQDRLARRIPLFQPSNYHPKDRHGGGWVPLRRAEYSIYWIGFFPLPGRRSNSQNHSFGPVSIESPDDIRRKKHAMRPSGCLTAESIQSSYPLRIHSCHSGHTGAVPQGMRQTRYQILAFPG